jgi:hypothetical protein
LEVRKLLTFKGAQAAKSQKQRGSKSKKQDILSSSLTQNLGNLA